MTGEKRRTIRMADDVWLPLQRKAEREGRSASDVLRSKAVDYLGDDYVSPTASLPLSAQRLALVAGLVAAGVPDHRIPEAVNALGAEYAPTTTAEFVEQLRSTAKRYS